MPTFETRVFALCLWITPALVLAGILVGLVLVRVTTPRFRLEALSRVGWLTMLAQVGILLLCYLAGFLCAG